MLEFMLKAKNKIHFTKDELEQSKIIISFTLFDQEVHIDQITRMRQMRYVQNRFLGTFKIPLTTILSGTKFEGIIRLNRPLVLQDYHVVQDDLIFMDEDAFTEQQLRNEEQIPTYINLSITLEPLISVTRENDKDFYQGYERTPFLQAGTDWVRKIETMFK